MLVVVAAPTSCTSTVATGSLAAAATASAASEEGPCASALGAATAAAAAATAAEASTDFFATRAENRVPFFDGAATGDTFFTFAGGAAFTATLGFRDAGRLAAGARFIDLAAEGTAAAADSEGVISAASAAAATVSAAAAVAVVVEAAMVFRFFPAAATDAFFRFFPAAMEAVSLVGTGGRVLEAGATTGAGGGSAAAGGGGGGGGRGGEYSTESEGGLQSLESQGHTEG